MTSHLTLINLSPCKMYEGHLNSLALDTVNKAIADGATHKKEQAKPADGGGSCFSSHCLVHLVCVERTVENDNGPYQLGKGDHGIEALKAFECCVLLLTPSFIGGHV